MNRKKIYKAKFSFWIPIKWRTRLMEIAENMSSDLEMDIDYKDVIRYTLMKRFELTPKLWIGSKCRGKFLKSKIEKNPDSNKEVRINLLVPIQWKYWLEDILRGEIFLEIQNIKLDNQLGKEFQDDLIRNERNRKISGLIRSTLKKKYFLNEDEKKLRDSLKAPEYPDKLLTSR